jgi:putative membrane protein
MIKTWIISTITILLAAYILPGVSATLLGALVFAIVLGVINAFIKPIILALTLPINIATLGLFTLVINAGLIMLSAKIVEGFSVDGFLAALVFSVVVFLISALFGLNNDDQ